MAAVSVIFENLQIALNLMNNKRNEWPFSSMTNLRGFEEALNKFKGAVAALEAGDHSLFSNSLESLMTLLHQADDLFDEILTSANYRRVSRVSVDYLAFPVRLNRRVKKIEHEINQLGDQLLEKFSSYNSARIQFEPSESYNVNANTVIGRNKDKRKIKKLLLRAQGEHKTNVSIISIVGSTGIGKSALVRTVYDDEEIKSHFDLRMWIQVSKTSNEREIIREMVEACTKRRSKYKQQSTQAKSQNSLVQKSWRGIGNLSKCRGLDTVETTSSTSATKNEINMYELRLKKEIKGKRYLLVLDGAYITHGQRLKDILDAGGQGSRILITMHHPGGADFAPAENVKSYRLKGLSKDASWSLFKTYALKRENPMESVNDQLGREIALNCRGVPLTLKVAASFLYGKSEEQWSSFNKDLMLKSKHRDETMMLVLHRSYKDLPTRLKACFCYCSLFPEDHEFNKHDLISLWIAQGFIHPQQDQYPEQDAEKYFLELSRRCFFEDLDIDDLRGITTCKMHHIMRSLANQYAAGIVSMCSTRAGVNLDSTWKHVSFNCDRDSIMKFSSSKPKAQNLRTLLSFKEPGCDTMIHTLELNRFISEFRCLRALKLHDVGIKELPDSIGKLIHLRYLDLSKNENLVTLPNSFVELINLQTLKLNFCTNMERLPGNFSELQNLKRLEVDDCDSLTSMPLGLEKLTQLERLSRFVVGQDLSKDMTNSGLEALKELNNLRGQLAIELKGDWTTMLPKASLADLKSKNELVELKIRWVETVINGKESSKILSKQEKSLYRKLLDQLQPHRNLKILQIEGYKGDNLPIWAGVSTLTTNLPNLVVITIEGSDKCEHLPPFGKLAALKKLTLRHMINVQYVIGESFRTSSTDRSQEQVPSFFPSLEELTLHNFYKMEGWWKPQLMITTEEKIPSFHRLSKLRLRNCPNLRSMPLFTEVSELDLINVSQKLLEECAKRVSKDTKSCIRRLMIMGCPNLCSFAAVRKGLGGLHCLKELEIEKCHGLTLLASEMLYLTSLERLEISRCKDLDLSHNCSSISKGSFDATSRVSRRIYRSIESPWKSLKFLLYLTLRELPKMETLPEGLKHVRSLRSLWISACPALTALPEWIDNLTALQNLRIESCQNIKTLPDGINKVKSLMKIEIFECLELVKSCKPKGKDWHKINHVGVVLLHKSWRHGLVLELGTS